MARASVTSGTGSVRVTTRGRISLDLRALAKTVGVAAVGHIIERVDASRDIRDRAFASYSKPYAAWLEMGGENPAHVDLRLTGGLLNSVAVRQTEMSASGFTLTIGPGTGTSEQRKAVGRGKSGQLLKRRRMAKTGKRGPAHNLLGSYLQVKRPWLGMSPTGMRMVRALLERVGFSRR